MGGGEAGVGGGCVVAMGEGRRGDGKVEKEGEGRERIGREGEKERREKGRKSPSLGIRLSCQR